MGDFQSLQVWRKAHRFTLRVYHLTSSFPRDELFGLTGQIRRSAVSIPANIAEGCGRNSDAELARFCRIALGSANELAYHLLLARDLGYLGENAYSDCSRQIAELRRMLASFVGALSTDS